MSQWAWGFMVGVMVYLCVMLLDISLAPTVGFTLYYGSRQYKLALMESSLCNQERSTWTKPDLLTPPIPALQSSMNLSETLSKMINKSLSLDD